MSPTPTNADAMLLLIPGMFNTPAIWDPVRAELERLAGAPAVRVADVLTQDSIGAMADDAWSCVADLPADQPLTVAGFSMGGYVALELMARHPDRVQALGMVDSAAGVETPESLVVREKTIGALERNFARTVEGIITFSLHPDHAGDSALVDGMRTMMHAVGAEAAIRQTRALMQRRDHRGWLAQWRRPALVLCGRADKVTPPAASEELMRLLPHARQCWIESAGHQTPLEAPATVAAELAALAAAATSSSSRASG